MLVGLSRCAEGQRAPLYSNGVTEPVVVVTRGTILHFFVRLRPVALCNLPLPMWEFSNGEGSVRCKGLRDGQIRRIQTFKSFSTIFKSGPGFALQATTV